MAETAKDLISHAVDKIRSGQPEMAIDLARQAIDADPRASDAYTTLGVALKETGKVEEARAAFQQAIQTGPYNASAYYNLALFYYEQGLKGDAVSMAQEAIRTDGRHKRSIELLKRLDSEMHVEVAPYTTSIGDNRGSAYRYGPDNNTPPTEEANPFPEQEQPKQES